MNFKQAHPIHLVGELETYLKAAFVSKPNETDKLNWRLFVVLFVRPANQLGKREIIPNLDYLHYTAGDHLDFFCVGYYKLNQNAAKEPNQEIIKVGDGSWGYSNLHFNKLKQFFESESKWEYSGRSDMIIANYSFHNGKLLIDYSGAIALNLEDSLECRAINSIEEFITEFPKFVSTYTGKDPAFAFFKNRMHNIARKTLWQYIKSLLPKWFSDTPQQLNTFMLVDLRKTS